MKRHNILLLFLFFSLSLTAQNITPPFVLQDVRVEIPSFLPGLMKDPAATVQNDTLIYTLNGMLFRNGYKIYGGSKNLPLADPFETLFEMADAYAKKDRARIVSLYTTASAEQVQKLVNGPEGAEFLNYVHSTAVNPLDLLALFEYKNGYITFVRDNGGKVHINYILKEGEKYKLAAFNDNKAVSWNLNVFFNTMPQEMVALKTDLRKESMAVTDSVMIQMTVPTTTPYVAVFTGRPGESAALVVVDNSKADLNLTRGRVSFYLPGSLFHKTGDNTFYIGAFNYPVSFSSPTFFVKEAEHTITITD